MQSGKPGRGKVYNSITETIGDTPLVRIHRMSDDEFAVVRIILREAMVSSTRLRELIKRFTAEQAHVPLLLQALGQEIDTGRARDDLPLPALLLATMALAMGPAIVRRLALGAGQGAQVPGPELAAAMQVRLLFEGIGAAAPAKPKRRPKRR